MLSLLDLEWNEAIDRVAEMAFDTCQSYRAMGGDDDDYCYKVANSLEFFAKKLESLKRK